MARASSVEGWEIEQAPAHLDEDPLLVGLEYRVPPLLGRIRFQQAAGRPGLAAVVRRQQRDDGVGRRLLLGAHDGLQRPAAHVAIRVFEQIEQALPCFVGGVEPHEFGRLRANDLVLVARQFQQQRHVGSRTVELHQVQRPGAIVCGIRRAAGHAQQHRAPVALQLLLHLGHLLAAPGTLQLRLPNGRRNARAQVGVRLR